MHRFEYTPGIWKVETRLQNAGGSKRLAIISARPTNGKKHACLEAYAGARSFARMFPRKAIPEDIAANKELMFEILECAPGARWRRCRSPFIADRPDVGYRHSVAVGLRVACPIPATD
jgi:hypothetical protein